MHTLKKERNKLNKPDVDIFLKLKNKKIKLNSHPFKKQEPKQTKKIDLHLDTFKQIDSVIEEYEKQTKIENIEDLIKNNKEPQRIVEIRETSFRKPEFSAFQTDLNIEKGFKPSFEIVPDPVFVNKNITAEQTKQNFDKTVLKVAESKTKTSPKVEKTPINNIVKQEKKLQRTIEELEEQKKQIEEAEKQAIEQEKQLKILEKEEEKKKKQRQKQKEIETKKRAIEEKKKAKQLQKQQKLEAKQRLIEEKKKQKELEKKQRQKQIEQKQIQTELAAKQALEREKELAAKQKAELKQQKIEEKQRILEEKKKQKLQQKEQKQTKKSLFKKEKTTDKPIMHNLPTTQQETFLDEDVKKVLEITDELLGKLPDEVIDEFVQSKDFDLYMKVINKVKNK